LYPKIFITTFHLFTVGI